MATVAADKFATLSIGSSLVKICDAADICSLRSVTASCRCLISTCSAVASVALAYTRHHTGRASQPGLVCDKHELTRLHSASADLEWPQHVQQMMHISQQSTDICSVLGELTWLVDQNTEQFVKAEEDFFVQVCQLLLEIYAGSARAVKKHF